MSLELKDLKGMHEKAYTYGQQNRQDASDDMVFKFVNQWGGNLADDFLGSYRGEFDELTKAIKKIISDLYMNPVQVDFEPLNEAAEQSVDMLSGIYITEDGKNTSIEGYENAEQEAVVCGVGAWKLKAEYTSILSEDHRQKVVRYPIYEANNTVFWDPNAKLMDKSDAKFCSVLTSYTPDAYLDLVEELTGERPDQVRANSFAEPETSYTFPWVYGEGEQIYVVEFYHTEIKKVKILTLTDPFGEDLQMRASDLTDVMDDMIDEGFTVTSEKQMESRVVTQYIASGAEILDETEIACDFIPIIPMYGEYAYVEGVLTYKGTVRRAKDPQRLRNFALSYLASIVQSAPKEKNIYWPDQIAGLERFYEQQGADDNYPYALMNRMSLDGSTPLPAAPIGVIPSATMPPALGDLITLSSDAISAVADPGIPQNVADVDISGKAVMALQAELDKQSMTYQQHRKHAKRRDAEVFASFQSRIMDIPQEVITTSPDGTRTKTKVMDTIQDAETGNIIVLNDIRDAQFEIFTKIGPSYSSKRKQSLEMLQGMVANIDPGDPLRKALQLKQLALMDSFDFNDIREYANKQLVMMGFKEPETDEEKQMLAEAQNQPEKPDAGMVLAMAEMKKGEAAEQRVQIEGIKVQLNAQNEEVKRMIEEFKAATDRGNMQVAAQEAGATINYKRVDTMGKEIDNAVKMQEITMPKINMEDFTDDDLFQQLRG